MDVAALLFPLGRAPNTCVPCARIGRVGCWISVDHNKGNDRKTTLLVDTAASWGPPSMSSHDTKRLVGRLLSEWALGRLVMQQQLTGDRGVSESNQRQRV